ncbi:molybdopterin-binding protein [Paracoccaceae bacterium]|nr:molybdopterin-binding protein [Paracoccaceae bacterium]
MKKLKNDCFALPAGVDWTPLDDALLHLETSLTPIIETEALPINSTVGRILADDLKAVSDSPPFPNSAVDGFAFKLTNSTREYLELKKGRAAAGHPFSKAIEKGQAIRIFTGAVLPTGTDTVVLQEDVRLEGNKIYFENSLQLGSNTRTVGEDINKGQVIAVKRDTITAFVAASSISSGIRRAQVYKKLRVGIFSTGDELIDSEQPLKFGSVFDVNSPMLASLLTAWGYEVSELGKIPDNLEVLRDKLNKASETFDVLITSGGASAGDEDHLASLLNSEGKVTEWRVAIKPGRPMAMGFWHDTPIFGLPGNPVAAATCALIFVRPALSKLSGGNWIKPQAYYMIAAFEKTKKAGRREFLRARASNNNVEIFKSEGSGLTSGLAWATGFVELPDEKISVRFGDKVKYIPFSSFDL